MAVIIQIRNDKANKWTSINPILAEGEVGIEMDTKKFKIGDGTKHWSELSYFTPGEIGDLSSLTTTQKDNLVDAINELDSEKQDIITGGASTITSSNLTESKALVSDSSGKVAVSSVTSTELGYLSGVASSVQTQLNGKASTSLDNLSSSGQMIIDTQNGTISNCILNIPQDIKLENSNGSLVLKSGSVITAPNGTQYTTQSDFTINPGAPTGQRSVLVGITSGGSLTGFVAINGLNLFSGTMAPTVTVQTAYWLDTTNTVIKRTTDTGSTWAKIPGITLCLPVCLATFNAGTLVSIDQVYNGAGYVEHNAFVLPGVCGLRAIGFNEYGTLKSQVQKTTALQFYELPNNRTETYLYITASNNIIMGSNVSDGYPKYVTKENWCYSSSLSTESYLPVVKFATDSNSNVTVFELDPVYGLFANTTSVIATGSTTARQLKDRFADVINVKDFGAVGDGVCDDTIPVQKAIKTGMQVFFPHGVYRITDELLLTTPGQYLFGVGSGWSYSNPSGHEDTGSTLLFDNPTDAGVRYVKTRAKYRANSSDPEDAPLSAAVNIQNNGVKIEHLCIRLVQTSGQRYGADWDVGIFIGSRLEVKLNNIAVVGAFKEASVYADVTAVSSTVAPNVEFTNHHGVKMPAHTSEAFTGIDGFSLMNSYISGAKWGVKIKGADWASGHTAKDVQYYDAIYGGLLPVSPSNNTIKDTRGESGASDVLLFNSTIFCQDGNNQRMQDPVVNASDRVDWATGDDDDCGGCLVVDGACGFDTTLNGHNYIRNRFMTHIAPFNVKLVKSSYDTFIGNQFDGCNPGTAFVTAEGVPSTISNANFYGKIYKSIYSSDTEFISSQWDYHGFNDGHWYNDVWVTEVPTKRGDWDWFSNWQADAPLFKCGTPKMVLGYDDYQYGLSTNEHITLQFSIPDGSSDNKHERICFGKTSTPEETVIRHIGTSFDCLTQKPLNLYGTTAVTLGIIESGNNVPKFRAVPSGAVVMGLLRPNNDDAVTLGAASYRWKEIYCTNATINTSDERQKQDVCSVDERVLKAWGKVEFKQFLFNDAVEKKGKENARIHFGLIAQKVKDAFESEDLDPFKYGLLCYDEWDDEYEDVEVVDKKAEYDEKGSEIEPAVTHVERQLVRKAGNSYGIRYSEALALECAYQRWVTEKLEKRLAALEKK